MKVLFLGDIVGRPGRRALKNWLPEFREKNKIDFVIAQGENLASGAGLTIKTFEEAISAGIDFLTGGNHTLARQEFWPFLDDKKIKVLRPENINKKLPGRGVAEVKIGKNKLTIISLQGQAFMPQNDIQATDAFVEVEKILKRVSPDSLKIVDFHAEATSEKEAMGFYLDGKVDVVLGTHPHVLTNDLRTLPKGTLYLSDVGMVGPLNSIIGITELEKIQKYFPKFETKFEDSPVLINGLLIEFGKKTKGTLIKEII